MYNKQICTSMNPCKDTVQKREVSKNTRRNKQDRLHSKSKYNVHNNASQNLATTEIIVFREAILEAESPVII